MKKRYWIIPACILVFLVAFFPTFLSTNFGRSILESYLSDQDTKYSLEGSSFTWFGPQKIDALHITTKHTRSTIDSVIAQTSFIALLSKNLGNTTIKHVLITMDGQVEKQPPSALGTTGNFAIEFLSIQEKSTNLQFTATNVSAKQEKKRRALYLNGESSSSTGKGSVAIALDFAYPLYDRATPFALQCSFESLPTDVLTALTLLTAPEYATIPPNLFGSTLTLHLRGDKQNDEILLFCAPRSPNLSGEVYARLSKGLFSLSKTSRLSGMIQPAFINPILAKKDIHVDSKIQYSITAERLAIPIVSNKLEMKSAAFIGGLKTTGGRMTYGKHPLPLYLQEADIAIRSESLENALSFSGKIEADYGQRIISSLFGSGSVRAPFREIHLEKLQCHAQQLPLTLIGEYTGYPLASYLGEFASGFLTYNGVELTGEILTSRLKTSPFSFSAQGLLKLRSPIKLSYLVPESITKDKISPPEIAGTISSLVVNPNNIKEISGAGSFTVSPFEAHLNEHVLKCRTLQLELKAPSLQKIGFSGNANLQYKTMGLLQALIPSAIPFQFNGEANGENGNLPNVTIQTNAQHIQGILNCAYLKNELVLTTPATITVQPSLELFNGHLTRFSKDTPLVRTTAPWKIAIDSLTHKKGHFSTEGMLTTSEVTLETQNLLFPSTFTDVKASFALGQKNSYSFSGINDAGTLLCSLQMGAETKIALSCKNIPASTLDTLLNANESYEPLLGERINLSGSLEGKQYCDSASLSVVAPLVHGNITLTRSGDTYFLGRGTNVVWSLTPQGYQNIADPNTRMRLLSPATIDITFDKYTFPMHGTTFFPTKADFFAAEALDGNLTIPDMHFIDTLSNEQVSLTKLSSTIHRKSNSSPLSYTIKSSVSAKSKEKGLLSSTGEVQNYTLPDGRISFEKVELITKGTLSKIPSPLLDALLAAGSASLLPPSALFGETVSMEFDAQLKDGKGPLTADIRSPYFQANVDAFVEQGVAHLRKPLTAVIVMTPRLSSALLGSVAVEAVSIEKPITLIISPRGFSLPLLPFSIAESNVGQGMLDLGQIIVRDIGSTMTVGDIFELKARAKNIHLWFAPLDFSIDKGFMFIDRTEILYDKTYDIAIWGRIDLIKEYVNMTLGLTAQSLKRALGLSLPENYVLQVPFKGPIKNVKIDKGVALSKIAFIIAREQGKRSDNIYGNIFGILGDLADDQSSVPPPKPPFPWNR